MSDKIGQITAWLDENLGVARREHLMQVPETGLCSSPVGRARWVKGLVNQLEEEPGIDPKAVFGADCPCRMGEATLARAREILADTADPAEFVATMASQRVIGRKIWYEAGDNTIYITKVYACDSGGGYAGSDSLIARRCHCGLVHASDGGIPLDYCYCGARFYYPLFTALFGTGVRIEPVTTVLAGGSECIFAIRLSDSSEAG